MPDFGGRFDAGSCSCRSNPSHSSAGVAQDAALGRTHDAIPCCSSASVLFPHHIDKIESIVRVMTWSNKSTINGWQGLTFRSTCFRCIKSKRYALGRKLLDEEIFCLCDTGLIATDYLLYYYYGGLVCAALKEHAKALKLFEMAITIPTSVPDAIIVAAWHRYQIITALSTGLPSCCEKYASILMFLHCVWNTNGPRHQNLS